MDTTTTNPVRPVRSALLGVRAQVASAGLIWAALVLAPRWTSAPEPVARLVDGLPSALTGLPPWTAALGALLVLAALVAPRRR
ncbi:MAG: hypothetical protein F2825_01555 [Actinobacteria bacterium]|uniref:Unannotated protein n=1 Tax=freshwater metagenome TaxID=449393 RepID=A0A6J7GBE0_9ZZZZ|nr:hypothetical protein [Actinomycetota bacterium]